MVEKRGIDVPNNAELTYLYLSISVPPCEPVVIRFQSPIPNETGGTSVEFYELSHPTLGQGAAHGFTVRNGYPCKWDKLSSALWDYCPYFATQCPHF